MKRRMLDCADELSRAQSGADRDLLTESVALLRWLAADRFTFLGARDYLYARDAEGRLLPDEPIILEESGVGLLADPARYVLRTSNEPFLLTPEIQRLLKDPTPLIVAKSTIRSRVHRRVTADYIGVKRYDAEGAIVGETRFVGLFAADAYTEMTREIPVIRRKVEWVLEHAGFTPGGHNEKTLRNILETYPRDELWQITQEELLRIARGVLHLLDRPRARTFNRRDPFNRFVTALAYLPKDRRFAAIANRFDWTAAARAEIAGDDKAQARRHRTALRFERVLAAKVTGIDLKDKRRTLSILALQFEETSAPAGAVTIVCAAGAAVRLEVECLEVELKDLGAVWAAKAKPHHDDEPSTPEKPE